MSKNLSRKEFFKFSFAKATHFVSHLLDEYQRGSVFSEVRPRTKKVKFVRPPGALPKEEFLSACTRCDDCTKACPHWVIRKAGPELGSVMLGTPIILPAEDPCLICEDFPCIQSCESGALRFPANNVPIRIGLAAVDAEACYSAQEQPCDYCMVHCPTSPKAIDATTVGQVPTIDIELCTGCGICAQICPPDAIRVEAL